MTCGRAAATWGHLDRRYLGAGVVGEGDERDKDGNGRGDEDDTRGGAARAAAAAAVLVGGAVGAAAQRGQPPHDAHRVLHRAGQQVAPRQRLEARLKRLIALLDRQAHTCLKHVLRPCSPENHRRLGARLATLLTEQAQILYTLARTLRPN